MSELQTEPIAVAIVHDTTKSEPRPKEYRSAHRTFVLTATVPVAQIAGPDPGRHEIRITVSDNPVVISGSSGEAEQAANTAAGLANPVGRYLPASAVETVIPGQNECWVSAAVYPTRIGVTIVRCI